MLFKKTIISLSFLATSALALPAPEAQVERQEGEAWAWHISDYTASPDFHFTLVAPPFKEFPKFQSECDEFDTPELKRCSIDIVNSATYAKWLGPTLNSPGHDIEVQFTSQGRTFSGKATIEYNDGFFDGTVFATEGSLES